MRIHPFGSMGRSHSGLVAFVPGALLIGVGLCVLVMPELLRYLVGGFFLLVGSILLGAAWQMRRGALGRGFVGFVERMRPPNRP
ncbi:MAG: hypothetical protein AB7I19_02430 [Planctomycetota bacterium]